LAKDRIQLAELRKEEAHLEAISNNCLCVDDFVQHWACAKNLEEYEKVQAERKELEASILGGEQEVQQLEGELSEDEIQASWAAGAVVVSAFLILILLALSVPLRMYMD